MVQASERFSETDSAALTANDFRGAAREIVGKWAREHGPALGSMVGPQLLAMATNPRQKNRADFIEGAVRDLERPADLLLPTMRKLIGEQETRAAVLNLLIDYGAAAERAVPELIEALGDKNRQVPMSCMAILYNIGTRAKAAVPALERALDGPERDSVAAAVPGGGSAISPSRGRAGSELAGCWKTNPEAR